MSPAHEHMATSVLRVFIEGAGDRVAAVAPGPTLLVTTPSGQRHEIGALLALASAASVGWKVAYLGPDLPAEEIASAARQTQAAAVALSIVYPENDPDLEGELQTLRRHLSSDVHVLVGGRAAAAYATAIDAIGGVLLGDLSGFRATLEQLATSRNTTGEIR
jgi:methylmalonyl-CoA mutase cobalamin-binding subunit